MNTPAIPEFGLVHVDQLRESKFNPRKHYDSNRLVELAASIKQQGVMQPLVVRPTEDAEVYEIVAGSRRFRAAKMAKAATVPVVIRVLSDLEAMKISTIENLQREDVHPLEEAAGYQLLLKQGGYDVPALAGVVGKSESYIYQRLKLLELEPKVREAFFADKISAGHAILLARLTPPDQKEGLAACLDENQLLSVRGLMAWIEEEVHRDLSKVQFDVADATLRPGAGACTTCPKRSGNQRSLFPEIERGDVCLDPVCFKAKHVAFLARREHELKTKKEPVVRISTGYGGRGLNLEKGQVLRSYDYTKAGAKKCPSTKIGLVVSGENIGADLRICTNPKCRIHHPAAPRQESTPAEKAARRQAEIDKFLAPRVLEAVLRQVKVPTVADRQAIVLQLLENAYGDQAEILCQVHEINFPKGHWNAATTALCKEIERCRDPGRLLLWALEVALVTMSAGEVEEAAKRHKVNVGTLRRTIVAELGAGKKTKAIKRGVCRICGCTETTPCDIGIEGACAWADKTQTLCTNPACLKTAKSQTSTKIKDGK